MVRKREGAVFGGVLLALALGVLLWFGGDTDDRVDDDVAIAIQPVPHDTIGISDEVPDTRHSNDARLREADLRDGQYDDAGGARRGWPRVFEVLHSEKSFYATVDEEYPKAMAGNAESLYLVWILMSECDPVRRLINTISFPEWLASLQNPDPEFIEERRVTYAQCEELVGEENWARFDGWQAFLDRAAVGAYPLAMAYKGTQTASENGATRESESYLKQAIGSGDPNVLFLLGLSLTANEQIESTEYASWIILACLNGFECDRPNPAIERGCQFDPECARDESVNSLLLRDLGQYELDIATEMAESMAELVSDCGFECLPVPAPFATPQAPPH